MALMMGRFPRGGCLHRQITSPVVYGDASGAALFTSVTIGFQRRARRPRLSDYRREEAEGLPFIFYSVAGNMVGQVPEKEEIIITAI